MNIKNYLRENYIQYIGIFIALIFYYLGWKYDKSIFDSLFFLIIFFIAVFFPFRKKEMKDKKITIIVNVIAVYFGVHILIASIRDGAFVSMLPMLFYMIIMLLIKYYISKSYKKNS